MVNFTETAWQFMESYYTFEKRYWFNLKYVEDNSTIHRHIQLYTDTFNYIPTYSTIHRHIQLYTDTFNYTPTHSTIHRHIHCSQKGPIWIYIAIRYTMENGSRCLCRSVVYLQWFILGEFPTNGSRDWSGSHKKLGYTSWTEG